MVSKTLVRKTFQKFLYRRNRTHYLKWRLDDINDWSIRYFIRYDTRAQYRNQWVLKSHITKDHIIISKNEAVEYLEKYCSEDKLINPEELFSINHYKTHDYHRVLIDQNGIKTFIE